MRITKVVSAWRYESVQCGCTIRVYPQGVGYQQISHHVIGLAVMLYVLGLSYGAVVIVLEALGIEIDKSSVYRAVQAAAEKVPGMKQQKLSNGMTLTIDGLPGEEAEQLKA